MSPARTLLLLAAWLLCANQVRAAECAARDACKSSEGRDVVQLRDGSVLCGTIVFRDDGHSLLVVDAAHQNRTISWDDIACMDQHAAVAAPVSAQAAPAKPASARPEPDDFALDDEPSERSFWLEWDVRFSGTTYWKRYSDRVASAWSWGMGGGLGFGATVHYALAAGLGVGPIHWSDLELGLAGTVSYGRWHQINAGEAVMIEQDLSLRVGTRFRLGGPTSGFVVGISWLPTYVDFYGRQIQTPGTINPLGMRLTFDLGDDRGTYRHTTVLRIALSFLPYVGRLPSMLALSAGIALD